jgi:hypothetical protein
MVSFYEGTEQAARTYVEKGADSVAVKTYRYKLNPCVGLPLATFRTEPTFTEISGGPYIVDVTVDENEKPAIEDHFARNGWSFVEEVI